MKKLLLALILFFMVYTPLRAELCTKVESFIQQEHSKRTTEKIAAPILTCIQSNSNGDVTISWTQVIDPFGSFISYEVHSVQLGLLATIPSIATTSYTDLAVSQKNDYFILVNADTQESTDTLSNIFLTLNNPSDGTALLQWNDPSPTSIAGMSTSYQIMREYPVGTWTEIGNVPFGTHFFKDTIDVCQAFLSYQVVLETSACNYTSNILGDNFTDKTTPDIPVISSVTIDTLSSNVTITWNQNGQTDTYGYIIYGIDANGFQTEIDTVWGRASISYTYSTDLSNGALTYSVAAFDHCFTISANPIYQTSAKAEIHTSVFAGSTYNICANEVSLSWSAYVGWSNLSSYEVWGHIVGENWENFGSTTQLLLTVKGEALKSYVFAIKAISEDGKEAFSNPVYRTIVAPSQPSFHYLETATVNGKAVDLKLYIDLVGGVKEISFQRINKKGVYEEISRVGATANNIEYTDEDADVQRYTYSYRAVVVDSCDQYGAISNTANTMLLTVQTQEVEMIHYLNWTAYSEFKGSLLYYRIYRGHDGVYDELPIATVPKSQLFFQDDLNEHTDGSNSLTGKTCYLVEAVEGANIYGRNETSRSNEACPIIPPLIFIPNSFTPNGDLLNDQFSPVVSTFTKYNFAIYDRWEHLIFESTAPEIGWTGTIRDTGKKAALGTYIYVLRLEDGNGVEIIQRGHVNLLQ